MGKLSKVLCTKLNIMRLISVSIVMVVMIMLSFAVQIEKEEVEGEKEGKSDNKIIGYTVDNADYCIGYNRTDGLYITGKDSNGNFLKVEAPAIIKEAITVSETEDGKTVLVINGLKFKTNGAKPFEIETEQCGVEEGTNSDGSPSINGDSNSDGKVRAAAMLYIEGDAIVEIEGTCDFELDDAVGTANSANSGDLEATYGIYCTGKLDIIDGDGDGKLNIMYTNLYYYYEGISNGIKVMYGVFGYGVYSRNMMTIESNIDISTQNAVNFRGLTGISTRRGNIKISKGTVNLENNTIIKSNESSVTNTTFSEAEYRGIYILEEGDIIIQKSEESSTKFKMVNNKKGEVLCGIWPRNGSVYNYGGEIVIQNNEAVRATVEVSANSLSGISLNMDLNGYETRGYIYGVYISNASKSFVMNNGILNVSSTKDTNYYVFNLYGINSLGDVEILNSNVNVEGYAESNCVGIHSVYNMKLKGSSLTMDLYNKKALKGSITDHPWYYTLDGTAIEYVQSSYREKVNGLWVGYVNTDGNDVLNSIEVAKCAMNIYVDGKYKSSSKYYGPHSEKAINASTVKLDTKFYKNVLTEMKYNENSPGNKNYQVATYGTTNIDLDGDTTIDNILNLYTCVVGIKVISYDEYYYKYDGINMYCVVDGTDILIDTNKVTLDGTTYTLQSGWSLDSEEGLVLENFTFNTSIQKALEITSSGDNVSKVTLKGNNIITASPYQSGNTTINKTQYGIEVNGNALFSGVGKLEMPNKSAKSSYNAIYVNGSITLGYGTFEIVGGNYGIVSERIVTLAGCNMTVSGSSKAISAPSVTTDESYYETIVKNATVSSSAVTNKKVSDIAWASCTAATTAGQVNYYLRYNADNGKMYKVSSDGASATEITTEDVPGWRVETITSGGNTYNQLVLDDFNFSTAADICLETVGDTKLHIDYTATNENGNDPYYMGSLISYFDASSRTIYGIKAKGNLQITSEDVINIERIENGVIKPSNTGILVSIGVEKGTHNGNLLINGGTYNLNSDIGIDYITEGGSTIVENTSFSVDATKYAMRYLTDTNKQPIKLKSTSSANVVLKGTTAVANTNNFELHNSGMFRTVALSDNNAPSLDNLMPANFTSKTYAKLGVWANYYFIFDGTQLCMAWKDETGQEKTAEPYTTEELTSFGYKIEKNVLHVKDVEVITMADTCFKMVGETTGLNVQGTNVFKALLYHSNFAKKDDATKYGIVVESDTNSFSRTNTATLDVSKIKANNDTESVSNDEFIAVDISPKTSGNTPTVTFIKGTFTFDGEEAAMNINTSSNIAVNKNSVTLIGDKYGIKNGGDLVIDIDQDASSKIEITAPTTISTNDVILDDTGYFKTAITEAVQSGQTLTYPIAYNFTTYTSATIGGVNNYYYKFYAGAAEGNGELYKVSGSDKNTRVKINGTDNLIVSKSTNGNYAELTIKNLNFETCAQFAIEIVANGVPSVVNIEGSNTIKSQTYYNYPATAANPGNTKDLSVRGFHIRSNNHTFKGAGTINISKEKFVKDSNLESNTSYYSIDQTSEGSLADYKFNIEQGTYSINGGYGGICCGSAELNISDGSKIEVTGSCNYAIVAKKDVNIAGGDIDLTCSTGMLFQGGNLNVTGGTLDIDVKAYGLQFNTIEENVPISYTTTVAGNAVVNIKGKTWALRYKDYTDGTIICEGNGIIKLYSNDETKEVANSSNINLGQTAEYKTAVVKATEKKSETQSGSTINYPSPYDFTQYSYAEIGTVNQYYLQFDSTSGSMSKVGMDVRTRNALVRALGEDGITIPGWEAEQRTRDGVTYYALKLNSDFDFKTAGVRALTITGTNAEVEVTGTPKLTSLVYYNGVTDTTDYTDYGIVNHADNLVFSGTGTLTVGKEKLGDSTSITTNGRYKAIIGATDAATDVIRFEGGTYYFNGEQRCLIMNHGDIEVVGGNVYVKTENASANDAHVVWISDGSIDISGGRFEISSEMPSAIGVVFSGGEKKLSISNANAIIRGTAKAIECTDGDPTINIHACVKGSTSYSGENAVLIADINESFYDTYRNYDYFSIEPAIISVNIKWGDFAYTGTENWDPTTLEYNTTFTPTNGGDEIRISNAADNAETDAIEGSNIPVVARVSYAEATFATTHNIKYNLTGKIGDNLVTPNRFNDEGTLDGYQVDLDAELIYKIGLDVDPYSGKSLTNIASGQSPLLGQVTVTLSDY